MNKKWRLIISLTCFVLSGYGQNVVLKHTYYTSTFSLEKHIPVLVEYVLTKEMLTCAERFKRKNKFARDPELPDETNLDKDYKRSGYDRGHNMSAEDNRCSETGMKECFYFSNMFPQTHHLNAGQWKKLEEMERQEAINYDSVKVFIGSIGKITTIGTDSVTVPEYCWKVIYIYGHGYQCYIMPNNKEEKTLEECKVLPPEIESRCGVTFLDDKATIH